MGTVVVVPEGPRPGRRVEDAGAPRPGDGGTGRAGPAGSGPTQGAPRDRFGACNVPAPVAADTHQEKTEAPTPRRLEKARKEGRIPVSRDAAGVASMAAALGAVAWLGPVLGDRLRTVLRLCTEAASVPGDGAATAAVVGRAAQIVAPPLFGLLAAPLVAGTTAFALQTRGNVAYEALGFKWERVSLAAGLRRVFGSKHGLFEVLLALGKATVLAAVLGIVLAGALGTFAGLGRTPAKVGAGIALAVVVRVVLLSLLAMAALAVADYFVARGRVMEQIRMTKQEVKDEFKEQEGDPQIKARRRQRMRQLGRNRMIAATKDATVVVVNPTHYAVALRYEPERDDAPVLLAKGKDALAARIRAVARRNGVPIVSDPPVARAIYAAGRVGREIPPDLYEMVARVLAFLYRMQGTRPAP